MAYTIAEKLTNRIHTLGRGSAFTPKDFLDIASHETARQILSRLAREGEIRRLQRGIYEFPAFSKVANGPASPNPDTIAQAIARSHRWTAVPAGDTALNMLGLSTQVPAQWQYFSDGPTKKYTWSGGTIVLKHRANREMTTLSPKTALLVQALKTLGKANVDEKAIGTLCKNLSKTERDRALREARYVSSWVYEIIRRLAEKEKTHA
jgi:hypothetical protein